MDTFERVKEIICETLSCETEKVTPEASLAADLGADSLDAVELVMALEEAFSIEISDEKAKEMERVSDVVALVDSLR